MFVRKMPLRLPAPAGVADGWHVRAVMPRTGVRIAAGVALSEMRA